MLENISGFLGQIICLKVSWPVLDDHVGQQPTNFDALVGTSLIEQYPSRGRIIKCFKCTFAELFLKKRVVLVEFCIAVQFQSFTCTHL